MFPPKNREVFISGKMDKTKQRKALDSYFLEIGACAAQIFNFYLKSLKRRGSRSFGIS